MATVVPKAAERRRTPGRWRVVHGLDARLSRNDAVELWGERATDPFWQATNLTAERTTFH